jgi:hypothetical protein
MDIERGENEVSHTSWTEVRFVPPEKYSSSDAGCFRLCCPEFFVVLLMPIYQLFCETFALSDDPEANHIVCEYADRFVGG